MRLPIAMLGAVTALLLSPAVEFVRAEETEEQAVAAIEKLGTVYRAEDKPGKPIEAVNLSGSDTTDTDLVHLKDLKQLRRLDLNGTKVSDAGLVHLKDLKQLE